MTRYSPPEVVVLKLASVTVENYRSITKAYKIRLGDVTVLLGPNNEGKSNILLALVTAMNILTRHSALLTSIFVRRLYDWERDYPLHLQSKHPKGQSAIVLEFGLTEEELEEFRKTVRTRLRGTLPVRISIGPNGETTLSVHKKGPGATALSKKRAAIAKFVSSRLRIEHIPAVRTARSAQDVVESLVARELEKVEEDPAYQQAVAQVAAIQEPVLKALSDNIRKTLLQFLPQVRTVQISISSDDRYQALRQSCSITVDDGTRTLLQYKGDGVQSLAALGIMRHASGEQESARHSVIAIEEPESHLHPAAIHELRRVLTEMSARSQIVLTTHNPLFVDRVNVSSNIIVTDKRARPAKTIEEIREVLGVRASDNLRSAAVVLVVEGEEDCVALSALLAEADEDLSSALANGTLALDSLQGAGNLSYKLGVLRNSLCNTYSFLDDDAAGREAAEKARLLGLLTDADVTLAHCDGRAESELEDLYDPAIYSDLLRSRYGVSLASPRFRNAKKWSTRIRETFEQQGKHWTMRLESEIKRVVADAIAEAPASGLVQETRQAFDALVLVLNERLRAATKGSTPEISSQAREQSEKPTIERRTAADLDIRQGIENPKLENGTTSDSS